MTTNPTITLDLLTPQQSFLLLQAYVGFAKINRAEKLLQYAFEQYDRIMDQTDRKAGDLTLKCFSYSNSKADMNSCSGTLVLFEW